MYNNLNPKYKSFLFFLIKLSIIGGSLYFIYHKITQNGSLSFNEFSNQLGNILFKKTWIIPILLLFTVLNWFFEIFKWKTLANSIKFTSFYEATKQSLASHTVSLLTPYRIGEYGGKALYFPGNKKKIVLLNLTGNLYQLLVTILFGVFGVIYFIDNYDIEIDLYKVRGLGYFIGFILLLFITNKNRKLLYFFDFEKLVDYIKKFTLSFHLKIFISSVIRYLLFSHQFYFLLILFGAEIDYESLMLLIFSMYFIASFIPTITLFDWAIKGSVSIYIFSFLNIPEITIITITTLMWILNFALPAIIGILFVITFKPVKR